VLRKISKVYGSEPGLDPDLGGKKRRILRKICTFSAKILNFVTGR
jgi:hypothetical protein